MVFNSVELLSLVEDSYISWENPKLHTKVVDPTYGFPTMYPDPITYIKERSIRKINQAVDSKQLGLFDVEELVDLNQDGTCSLGTFDIHTSIKTFLPFLDDLKKAPFLAVDIETTGLDPLIDHLRVIQICGDGKHSHVLLTESIGDDIKPILQDIFRTCPLVFQNGTFDTSFLLPFISVFPKYYAFDTLIAAQVLDAGFYDAQDKAFGLGSLAKRYLNSELDKGDQKSFVCKPSEIPPVLTPSQLKYSANDTIATWRLAVILASLLKKKNLNTVYRELDHLSIAMAVDIKTNGVPIDKEYVEQLEDILKPELLEVQHKLQEALKLPNIEDCNSNAKVLQAFKNLGYEDLDSTGESALGSYFLKKSVQRVKPEQRVEIGKTCPAAEYLLHFREVSKTINTFVSGYKEKFIHPLTGKAHPSLNICGSLDDAGTGGKDVATGRFSSRAPNLLAFPADQKYRNIFKAPENYMFIKVDASQQEVRVLADISGDKNLQDIYLNEGEKPVDIYRMVASIVRKVPPEEITSKDRQIFKCLEETSYVMTPQGIKYIGQIKPGDIVKTYKGFHPVNAVIKSRAKTILLYTSKGVLRLTPDHKVYDVKTNVWKEAKDFEKGDIIKACLFEDQMTQELNDSSYTFAQFMSEDRIPLSFYYSNNKKKVEFIADLINHKAVKINDHMCRIYDLPIEKLNDIHHLLSTFGAISVLTKHNNKDGQYCIDIEYIAYPYLEKYGLNEHLDDPNKWRVTEKLERYETAANFGRVIDVIKDYKDSIVVDIEVDSVHEFYCNSVRVHNCVVLGVNYAAGPKTVAALAGVSEELAAKSIKEYMRAFPGISKFTSATAKQAKSQGYLANAYSGRKRHWNQLMLKSKGLEFLYNTQSGNFMIQGGSADCIKKAFHMAYVELSKLGGQPCPPVHDK